MLRVLTAGIISVSLFALLGTGCAPRQNAQESPVTAEEGPVVPTDLNAGAAKIIDAALADDVAYQRLTSLCDRFGPRPAGGAALDRALAWAAETMKQDGMANVALEPVTVPYWERGRERLEMIEPWNTRDLPLLGLGRSVGTPPEGIRAEVLVVGDFDELDRRGSEAKGKIVLFDFPMKSQENMFAAYGEAVQYRWWGAERAAGHGAVAALVRSVTTRSLGTPHTGAMKPYDESLPKIPAAAITIEDSAMLARLAEGGERIVLRLTMGAHMAQDRPSANAVGELSGREHPEEIVVIGGHIDSWDVGQGAHDDGAGVIYTLEALRLLQSLGLQPRRTIRAVLFTNEERGLDGGEAYLERHGSLLARHVAALEADTGGFRPTAFSFAGSDEAAARIEALLPMFEKVGVRGKLRRGGAGADIGPIVKKGVPGLGLLEDSTHYFDYHHSPADTLDKVDPAEFKQSLAAFTLMTWLLAEMPEPLPRASD